MANPQKRKGDRAELEAVGVLTNHLPGYCVARPMRQLGAGRREDVGDLSVLPDAAVQVRSYAASSIGSAVRSAAIDAVAQAGNAGLPFGLGMVPIPRAPSTGVRWLACVLTWPQPARPVASFGSISKAIAWLKDDTGPYGYIPYPRTNRVCELVTGSATPILIAPIEAWAAAYRGHHANEALKPVQSVS